jgi:hypothetical protein
MKQQPYIEQRWWTTIDAARRLGVSRRRVQQLAVDGDLPFVAETSWGERLYARTDVLHLQQERREYQARRAEKLGRARPKMLRATVTIPTSGTRDGAKALLRECETKRVRSFSDRRRVV